MKCPWSVSRFCFTWRYQVVPVPFFWKDYLCYIVLSLLFCQIWAAYIYVNLFLCSLFCSMDLFVFYFGNAKLSWLPKLYFKSKGQSSVLFSFNILMTILGLLPLSINLESICKYPQNNLLAFWLELYWIYISSWEKHNTWQYWVFLSKNIDNVFIYIVLSWFCSSVL